MLPLKVPSAPGVNLEVSSQLTELYNPKAFITHAALLRQAFAHCAKFPTAASRRSLDRVSVPVWLIILSDQLPVLALVSHYLTNKLIGRGLIIMRQALRSPALELLRCLKSSTSGISLPFGKLFQTLRQITHVLRTLSPL